MKAVRFCIGFLMLQCMAISAIAQEGYPLDGTWRGFWGDDQNLVVIVMNWDGENINGRINPGRNMVLFESANLDPDTWTVSFTSTSKQGEAIAFSGVLENIGSYNRTITGTWTLDGQGYPLVLTRE